MPPLPVHTALRYVQPLREGGSLPAVVETDGGLYVVKFRGAGQGPRALIAELIVGLIATELGLPVPDLALVDVVEPFGANEPDPEIRDILLKSRGLNVGLRYLDGAFNFEVGAAGDFISPTFAAEVVWLDAFLTNPDRTPKNPNLLVWDRRPWLIDHGAALYVHHDWRRADVERARAPFSLIAEHVLLRVSGDIEDADRRFAAALGPGVLEATLAAVPGALLMDPFARGDFRSAGDARERYFDYLAARLAAPRPFTDEAVRAR
ncbi:MAG: HipA family kinase, partial [Longimicrobiales bacterium]